MKYYADYLSERICSIAQDGTIVVKFLDRNTKNVKTIYPDEKIKEHPWLHEENGIGFYVEEMTKDEFDSFGRKWIWADSPSASENVEHSFRNYMKFL